ncbi:hypothetical protein BD289DRAFT_379250, partial [Coniella lustricola]
VCLPRGFQRLRNLPGPIIGSILADGILALVIGSVDYNFPDTSNRMEQRAFLILLSTLLTVLSPFFGVLTIWAQRPIVENHNRYALYDPFTDATAAIICDLPNGICIAVLFKSPCISILEMYYGIINSYFKRTSRLRVMTHGYAGHRNRPTHHGMSSEPQRTDRISYIKTYKIT